MKIVHIITRFIRGGADENTLLSCNAQAEAGHEVHLVYGSEFHRDILEKLHPNVKRHYLASLVRPLRPVADLRATWALYRLCRSLRPDIVHTHTSKAGFSGRVAAWAARVPVVIHGVHILPFLNVGAVERLVYLVAEKLLVPVTDAFVDVSEGMKQECIRHGIGGEAKHLVVASGMDTDKFRRAAPVSGEEFADLRPPLLSSWDEGEVILMAAAFEERKRQLAFLDAFVKIAAARPRAVLLFAGDGPMRGEIEARIGALGLRDRVSIIGFREDVERWMKRADLCVLSSEREGLPRVVVQYALAGRPIVATHLPGIEAIVRPGVTGFLTDRVEDMVQPVVEILSDAALARQLQEGIGTLDLAPWDSRTMGAQLESLYRTLMAARPPVLPGIGESGRA